MLTDVQEADIAVVGLLADEFRDIWLKKSRAILRTSLALLTSRRQRQDMTLSDVANDVSVTPGILAHSSAERLLRRSRRPAQRKLWRRIGGRTKQSRSRSRQGGRSSSSSVWRSTSNRVETLDVGVNRVLNITDDDNNDFVLIVDSTDAAYVSSRPPGCMLTIAHQTTPVAEYRFVVATSNSSSSSWQRHLMQRLDFGLAALQQAAVIKRLYYKWWTSTECLTHFTDPNIWTTSVTDDAADVDKTSDDERIFLQSPVSATRAEPYSTTRDRPLSTQISEHELDRGDMLVSELDEQSHTSQHPVRAEVNVDPIADIRDTTANSNHGQLVDIQSNVSQSLVTSASTRTSATATTTTSFCSPTTTTTSTTTTTKLPRRSNRRPDDDDDSVRTHDVFQRIASADEITEEDRFDWVALTGHDVEQDDERLSVADYELKDIAGLVSEQEMAVKEHWRSGSAAAVVGEVRESTTTASNGSRTVTYGGTSDDGISDSTVVSPQSMTLLLFMASLTFLANVAHVNTHL